VKDAVEDLKRGLRPCNVSRGAGMPARFEGKTAGIFLSTVFKKDEIEEFIEKNWVPLRNMEFACIASRYPRVFQKGGSGGGP
jgi:hypothetical protein